MYGSLTLLHTASRCSSASAYLQVLQSKFRIPLAQNLSLSAGVVSILLPGVLLCWRSAGYTHHLLLLYVDV